jgi:tRNA threonylcarbamoyl adenosine modification protein YeaZ
LHVPALTLAIEISNPTPGPAGVALGNDSGALLGEELLRDSVSGRHDDDLMPAIDRLFQRLGATPKDLAAVAVSVGPGGYTALRIAIATAKMLAEATGASTIPIPSALAAAWTIADFPTPALVCLGSKGLTTHATLLLNRDRDRWPSDARIVGLIDAAAISAHRPAAIIADATLPAPVREAATSAHIQIIDPRFSAAAVLSLSRLVSPVDPNALAPLYPREPEAVTLWRSRSR